VGSLLTVVLAASVLSGCSSYLAGQIVQPPGESMFQPGGHQRSMKVPVGPPEASIALWIFDPPADEVIRGTVLVLHGVGDGPYWMNHKAERLAAEGYRAVLVANRGYSESTGRFRTFGVVEKRDLSQVIDALEEQGELEGGLGILGMSYGAAMALEVAGYDRRVDAVVSVAAFSSMREITPHFIRLLLPVPGLFITEEEFEAIMDDAAARAAFHPDEANAARAIERTEAPVLIIHGTWDFIVPYEHAERLHAHANDDSELMPIPATGHIGAWLDLDGRVARATKTWFDRWLVTP
jgi:pimeloyl-ACP methyl ester carboxylesterase